MSSDTVMEAAPTTRADPKRRRSPVMELDEESPQAKRVRRSSPLSATNRMQTEPISNGRRAGSVKALGFDDVHGPGRSRILTAMQDTASVTSGKSRPSRALSSGLSFHMNRLQMQTPSSPTPDAGWQSFGPRTAGVAAAAYNVNRTFSSGDSTAFRSSVTGSVGPGQGDRMSAQPQTTPTGASFGPTRPSLSRQTPSILKSDSQSPATMKPTLERHADKAPWASRAGSVRAPSRLGDNSLRLRTTSLLSAASNSSYAPSNGPHSARAPSVGRSNGRTTPTPRDGHVSSPPLTSPDNSVVGSPPHSAHASLPPHAQRALELRNSATTTLRHARSFSSPYYGRLKVPNPSNTDKSRSSATNTTTDLRSDNHSRSQSATSAASATSSKTDTSSKADSKASGAPYSVGGGKSHGKKILEKRKAEERELEAMNLNNQEEMEDLHVEPIKKGKENANPAYSKTKESDAVSRAPPSSVSPQSQSQQLLVPPSSVSESNSATSSRTVREKPAHTLEKRTRIPEKDVLRRFNPATNERLNKAKAGRFSVPPDDDDDVPGVEEMKKIQEKTAPLVLPNDFKIEKFGAGSGAPSGGLSESTGSDAMNISPVKETYDQEDSPADMMSTTPTESTVKNSFKITPIIKPPEPASNNLFGSAPSTSSAFPSMGNVFPSQETKILFPSMPLAPPQAEPSKPTKADVAPPAFGAASGLGNVGGSTAPASLPFSFGAPPEPKPAAATPAPFSFGTAAPTSGSSSLFGGQANDKKSPPPPTVIVTEPPKPISSFFAMPPTATIGASNPSLFGQPAQPSKEAPKPLFGFPAAKDNAAAAPKKEATPVFSFGGPPAITTASTPAPTEPKKDAPPIFSFGAPPTTAAAITTPVKQTPAPFSFGNAPSATPSTPTTVSVGTPSPQKPAFPFPSSTPGSLPPLSTTPLGAPFSFEGTPSPSRPVPSGNDESPVKTPTKATFSFGAPSTTPLITPTTASNPFSFGNNPESTTPAQTPAPFSFGAAPSTASSGAPFTFGATPAPSTTTPAAPPPSGGFNFNFGAGTDLKNPFQATTPSPTKPFTFGTGPAPPPSAPSFSFGQSSGDATPTAKPVAGFNFGQSQSSAATPTPTPTSATGFSFGAPAASSAPPSNGLLFPSGPRTPLTKVLELDGMDTSPIRGGGSGHTPGGPSFSATSGTGFSFGSNDATNNGFGSAPNSATPFGSAPNSATPFGNGNTGFGAPSSSTFSGGGFTKDSSPAPTPSPFSFGGSGTASSMFGHSSTTPTPSGGFGTGGGFGAAPASPAIASPFNPPQSFSSPAASPFTQPATLGGPSTFAAGQRNSVGSALEFSAGGSDSDGRKIMPMPKSRRTRTAQETRGALQKARAAGF